MYNDVQSITLSSGLGLSRYLKVGEALNSRYALLSNGIVRTEEQLAAYQKIEPTAKMGDEMYKDLDGDNQITVKDQVNIGTTDPKLIYGIGLNVQYKKFGLSILGMVHMICWWHFLSTGVRESAEFRYSGGAF